ncbi:ABC transporter permease [candidate division WOR-3 bacterium]|nr:ABC transporter permease [candidate division WOR-3 bacterium]
MSAIKLALRNLRGAGVRTWLNGFALSLAFVAIIFGQGLLEGVNRQAERASIDFEFGGGQFWCEGFDPYDPLTFENAHRVLPETIAHLVESGQAVAILVVPGTVFVQGRMVPVLLKGISTPQTVLKIPTQVLADSTGDLPVLLGAQMAKKLNVNVDDYLTLQWRDKEGAFDAREARVAGIMQTSVGTIDQGQVWLPLKQLELLTGLERQATVVVLKPGVKPPPVAEGWKFYTTEFLLSDLRQMIKTKTVGQSIMFIVLFLLALLAIFDTQVFSIFRRRREIGTLIALGMTRGAVIAMFTFEGAVYGVLAALLGAIYGTPLFLYLSAYGLAMPGGNQWGFALEERMYPAWTAGLILGTTILVLITATFVSYLPTRRILKLKPTDALRGKWV